VGICGTGVYKGGIEASSVLTGTSLTQTVDTPTTTVLLTDDNQFTGGGGTLQTKDAIVLRTTGAPMGTASATQPARRVQVDLPCVAKSAVTGSSWPSPAGWPGSMAASGPRLRPRRQPAPATPGDHRP
jgi:hypothetical protein